MSRRDALAQQLLMVVGLLATPQQALAEEGATATVSIDASKVRI